MRGIGRDRPQGRALAARGIITVEPQPLAVDLPLQAQIGSLEVGARRKLVEHRLMLRQ